MGDASVEKKFEARIPMCLWDEYDSWGEGRGSVSNGTLLGRLLRLFLDLPEPTQLQILFGKDLPALIDPGCTYGDQEDRRPAKVRLGTMLKIARTLPAETIRLLGPEEQRELDELLTLLGPEPVVEPKRKEKKA